MKEGRRKYGTRHASTSNGRITHYFVAVKREEEERQEEPFYLWDDDRGKRDNFTPPTEGESPRTSTHPFFASNALAMTIKRARKGEAIYESDNLDGGIRWGEVRAWRRAHDAPMFPPLCNTDLGPIWSGDRVIVTQPMSYPMRELPTLTLQSILPNLDALGSPITIEEYLSSTHIPDFSREQFEEALREILAWIQVPEEGEDNRRDEDDLFVGWKGPNYAPVEVKTKRPIVMITGPSGVGKSRMAEVLSERLGVPLVEVNGAVSIRNGKPFDDILAGSHKQRALMRNFAFGGQVGGMLTLEQSTLSPSSIKSIVLIDEVDLVFVQDKLYPALGSFLKAAPSAGILTIITANADVRLMRRFIDFPPGTLFHHMSGEERPSPMVDDFTSLEEIIKRSDNSTVMLTIHQWIHHIDSPVYAIPWECQHYHGGLDEGSLHGHAQRISSYRALWIEVLRLGWARGCATFSSWCLEYLPGWRALERSARDQCELRTRRTNRPVAFRPYLRDVPEALVQKLLKL